MITIKKHSFGAFTLVDTESPKYIALNQELNTTNFFRDKKELIKFISENY